MERMRRRLRVAAGARAGCGLIDSDVARGEVRPAVEDVHLQSVVVQCAGGASQEVPCGAVSPSMDCCNPPPPLPVPDCAMTPLACEQNGTGRTSARRVVTVSQGQMMNLGQEVRRSRGRDRPGRSPIEHISYKVTEQHAERQRAADVAVPGAGGRDGPQRSERHEVRDTAGDPGDVDDRRATSSSNRTRRQVWRRSQQHPSPFTFIAATTIKVSHAPDRRDRPAGLRPAGVAVRRVARQAVARALPSGRRGGGRSRSRRRSRRGRRGRTARPHPVTGRGRTRRRHRASSVAGRALGRGTRRREPARRSPVPSAPCRP